MVAAMLSCAASHPRLLSACQPNISNYLCWVDIDRSNDNICPVPALAFAHKLTQDTSIWPQSAMGTYVAACTKDICPACR